MSEHLGVRIPEKLKRAVERQCRNLAHKYDVKYTQTRAVISALKGWLRKKGLSDEEIRELVIPTLVKGKQILLQRYNAVLFGLHMPKNIEEYKERFFEGNPNPSREQLRAFKAILDDMRAYGERVQKLYGNGITEEQLKEEFGVYQEVEEQKPEKSIAPDKHRKKHRKISKPKLTRSQQNEKKKLEKRVDKLYEKLFANVDDEDFYDIHDKIKKLEAKIAKIGKEK